MESWEPFPYQENAIKFGLKQGSCALFLNPGRGKTTIFLAVHKMLLEHKQIERTLVIAPKNPALAVWPSEVRKWIDFHDIGVEVLHGPDKDEKLSRLDPRKSLYVINYDGLKWFAARMMQMKKFPFQMLGVDESSYIKNTKTVRFKVIKEIANLVSRRFVLTGDPSPNSLLELFGQMYVVDRGASLGRFISHFRNEYFIPIDKGNYIDWMPKPDSEARIRAAIAPRAYTLTEEDQKGLPPISYNTIAFDLSPAVKREYDSFKRKLLLDFPSGNSITATNMGVLTNKLQQFTGGAVYHSEGEWEEVHDEKFEILADLIGERQGQPTIVVYRFRHELARMLDLFGQNTPYVGGDKSIVEIQDEWNDGKIPLLLAQEQGLSHGLNMQGVEAHVVWFYITPSLERYRQLNRRVYRTGQKYPVVIHHLVANDTWDVRGMSILASKDRRQQDLLTALRDYWNEANAEEARTQAGAAARTRGRKAAVPVARASS